MTEPILNGDKRRYFFAWHLVNGIPFAFKFATEDDIPVGGVPDIVGSVIEITREEFLVNEIAVLEQQHPFDGDELVSLLRQS